MSDSIEGTLYKIDDTKSFGPNNFRKRGFVVKTTEQYPQLIPMELVQDKCELLNPYKVGDGVKVFFNFRGNEWTSPQGEVKHFLSLQAWKIDDFGASESPGENPGAEGGPPEDTVPF